MIAKTQEEIDALREGGKRLASHLKALAEATKPGVTAQQLEQIMRDRVAADGDELAFLDYPAGKKGEPFPAGLCLSINDVLVHGPAAIMTDVIQDGDVVTLDCGIKHKGFFTDAAVTVIAGKADPKDAAMLRAAYEALQAGIDQARVGNRIGDIGAAIEAVADRYGYGFPLNLGGHGVGGAVHEHPHVPNYGKAGTGEKLKEGLVIAIEPMFMHGKGDNYIAKDNFSFMVKDGTRAVHVEHTVLVTKDGPEILTKL